MRRAISVCVIALVSCSQGALLSPEPTGGSNFEASPNVPLAKYEVVHSFAGTPDGAAPEAGLIAVNGLLYGTTALGGKNDWGAFFSITDTGKVRILHSFSNSGSDGNLPVADLINLGGTFYGTTFGGGGGNRYGTIFKVSTSGKASVLYRFKGGKDGESPEAGLTAVNGELFGTTYYGGASHSGTVFSITSSGVERVLHSFKPGDGENPRCVLLNLRGMLYGTTFSGGANDMGTVFAISTSGKERVLYSFHGGSDAAQPLAGLIGRNGELYGTTLDGGANAQGAVFAISTAGQERVLYSFRGGPRDGAAPIAALTAVNGVFYGTTQAGGLYNCQSGYSCGTVFSLTTAGNERVLHKFAAWPDGEVPYARLFATNGYLYGTTYGGGRHNEGTVFRVRL